MNQLKEEATNIKKLIETKLSHVIGCETSEATPEQMYKAVVLTVKDILSEKSAAFRNEVHANSAKRVYYMCIEFLLGRSLKNNLYNLSLDKAYREALSALGFSLEDLYELEPDAGLGNGGLGRLAACFMDSLSSLDYPATGFSLCYEYGLFRQKIVDGIQIELPDNWLPGGDVWLTPHTERSLQVKFGGHIKEIRNDEGHIEIVYEDFEEIQALPYDMLISGANSKAVSKLRLWRAVNNMKFNMGLFTQGQYAKALEESTNAEILTKVLYPSDAHTEGKLLRLCQQYFLVSASCQTIIKEHMSSYGTLDNLHEKVAIHINDTHPALCIPELMRILVDEYFFDWDKAWNIVKNTVSYTNHTVMPEALETWNEDLFKLKLPRIYNIIKEINERFCSEAWKKFPGAWEKISKMSIVSYNQVHMANLAIIGSHNINGVSNIHSSILKRSTFKDFYDLYPERFNNVTNGIAYRRWLCYSNPRLSALLDECIGTEYRRSSEHLSDLLKFESDSAVLERLSKIKQANKEDFAHKYYKASGKRLNPFSVFDVHIKRLHEYKRQLLNVLDIIGRYLELIESPNINITPRTYIFGAKAASGYHIAKRIIKLICMLEKELEHSPVAKDRLNVVFLEDYNVSTAEILVPAAEISEQISLAGKEASGTGCMKMMMNGAITIGTLDGANIEMQKATGEENMYIFGLSASEVEDLWTRGYNSALYYTSSPMLMKIVNRLNIGFAGESFSDIAAYLISGRGIADPYMCLADFDSYSRTRAKMFSDYNDHIAWSKKSLYNIAGSGYFSSDRSIKEYAEKIWNIKPV